MPKKVVKEGKTDGFSLVVEEWLVVIEELKEIPTRDEGKLE
jgi:hypothetical protein